MWRWRNEQGSILESLLSISKHKLDNLVLMKLIITKSNPMILLKCL